MSQNQWTDLKTMHLLHEAEIPDLPSQTWSTVAGFQSKPSPPLSQAEKSPLVWSHPVWIRVDSCLRILPFCWMQGSEPGFQGQPLSHWNKHSHWATRINIPVATLLCYFIMWNNTFSLLFKAMWLEFCNIHKSTLSIHWKNRCWSWSSNTLATWCEESIHWKRCQKPGKIEGRRELQRIRWLDVITNSMDMSLSKLQEMVKDRRIPGMLQSMGSQRVRYDVLA